LEENKIKKIRILQFPIANSNGGITHYALGNWKWMDRNQFICDFATMSSKLDFEDEILSTGSKIYYISCYAEENQEKFVREFDEILTKGYDVVHIHTKQWKSCLVEKMCKNHQIPKVIVHAHSTGFDNGNPINRKKEEQLHENVKQSFRESLATDFWACSKTAANFLFGKQISENRIKIMPNAIEIEKFAFNPQIRDVYRRKYGLDNYYVIGHVGRFEYQKNHHFLINLFYEILNEIDNAKLILLGDGKLYNEVKLQTQKLKIEEKVLFLGKRDDINNWYQAMDVFCLPSRFEGLPISVIEAQASGLPCICSNSISPEVKIGKNVSLLPLEKKKWIHKICEVSKLERIDNRLELDMAGYNIQTQIKVLEDLYKNCKMRASS